LSGKSRLVKIGEPDQLLGLGSSSVALDRFYHPGVEGGISAGGHVLPLLNFNNSSMRAKWLNSSQ
jgi:hypothetical protein